MAVILWIDRYTRFSSPRHYLKFPEIHTLGCFRYKQWKTRSQLPRALELHYSVYAQIYRHKRCRKAKINIENMLHSQFWSFRINSTLLGMIITDAGLIYLGEKVQITSFTECFLQAFGDRACRKWEQLSYISTYYHGRNRRSVFYWYFLHYFSHTREMASSEWQHVHFEK